MNEFPRSHTNRNDGECVYLFIIKKKFLTIVYGMSVTASSLKSKTEWLHKNIKCVPLLLVSKWILLVYVLHESHLSKPFLSSSYSSILHDNFSVFSVIPLLFRSSCYRSYNLSYSQNPSTVPSFVSHKRCGCLIWTQHLSVSMKHRSSKTLEAGLESTSIWTIWIKISLHCHELLRETCAVDWKLLAGFFAFQFVIEVTQGVLCIMFWTSFESGTKLVVKSVPLEF